MPVYEAVLHMLDLTLKLLTHIYWLYYSGQMLLNDKFIRSHISDSSSTFKKVKKKKKGQKELW